MRGDNPKTHLAVLKSKVPRVEEIVGGFAHGRAHHGRCLPLADQELHQTGYLTEAFCRCQGTAPELYHRTHRFIFVCGKVASVGYWWRWSGVAGGRFVYWVSPPTHYCSPIVQTRGQRIEISHVFFFFAPAHYLV